MDLLIVSVSSTLRYSQGTSAARRLHSVVVGVSVDPVGCGNTKVILNEVCKQVTLGNIVPDPGRNGFYMAYADVPRGNAPGCAWHSSGCCHGKALQFGCAYNLDGDASCEPPASPLSTVPSTEGFWRWPQAELRPASLCSTTRNL